jgi:hypothetical protein
VGIAGGAVALHWLAQAKSQLGTVRGAFNPSVDGRDLLSPSSATASFCASYFVQPMRLLSIAKSSYQSSAVPIESLLFE